MDWCFAIINGKLAEVYFEKKKNIKFLGHCFVKKSEFLTKREQQQIKVDTKKVRLTYKDEKYADEKFSSLDKSPGEG